ncbi:RDD family protein [Bacillus marasmi]|uniref:RDD family protein n=1 Tax=Bacillus marasmi TaxID=1926279 RepID=UPI0011C9730E|nr:RDD family protein [Bacillus marasmi]
MVSNPAGFWRRLGAGLIDGIIISVPLTFLFGLFLSETSLNSAVSIIELLYAIILPVVWSGYTIGKKLLGVRIVKVNGERVGFGTMLIRTIVAGFIYAITLGIGVIVSAFMVGLRSDKRAIHDFIAGTYVTHD